MYTDVAGLQKHEPRDLEEQETNVHELPIDD